MTTHSFKEALLNRRMLICVFTGFTSGLPLYILIQLVPAWLRTEGVSLTDIGFFALVGLPYNWKFVWAPLLDRFSILPIGRRRSWMLVTQILLLFVIAVMGYVSPKLSLTTVAMLASIMALFSATQDIALDAYRRELLEDWELGLGNSIHVQAYRLAGLIPGALSLILADYIPWHYVFMITAMFMLVGVISTLMISEAIEAPIIPRTLKAAVVDPFKEYISRRGLNGALLVLAFIFAYKLGDNLATALQTAFFIDMGFSLTEIGTIAKTASLVSAIVGGLLGGLIMVKLGINRSLWIFGVVQLVTIFGFLMLSVVGDNPWALGVAVSLEYLGVGLGTTAVTAFVARETNPVFAATQLALFLAIATLPRTVAAAGIGVVVDAMGGWTPHFFLLCAGLAIPGMLLLFKVAPWNGDRESEA